MYFLFSLIIILSFMVITTRNLVYSLTCLISTFFVSACLLISLHLEFLGYVLVIVYVGAIAILFLFVIMTLDLSQDELSTSLVQNSGGYFPNFIGFIFFITIISSVYYIVEPISSLLDIFPFAFDIWSLYVVTHGTYAISVSLYTFNFLYLFLSGLLLLAAMIGATFLTVESPFNSLNKKKQIAKDKKKLKNSSSRKD